MKIALATLAVLGLIGLGCWLVRVGSLKKARLIEEAFTGRMRLTTEQFYGRFFMGRNIPFQLVADVLKILAEQLDADLSRLVDEDDFSKNLSFFWDFDSLADVEIICALEREFAIEITDFEAENIRTVKELANLVAKKVEALNA